MLVGTGIGITPFASILQSISRRYTQVDLTLDTVLLGNLGHCPKVKLKDHCLTLANTTYWPGQADLPELPAQLVRETELCNGQPQEGRLLLDQQVPGGDMAT